jgi:hypothetical protein
MHRRFGFFHAFHAGRSKEWKATMHRRTPRLHSGQHGRAMYTAERDDVSRRS